MVTNSERVMWYAFMGVMLGLLISGPASAHRDLTDDYRTGHYLDEATIPGLHGSKNAWEAECDEWGTHDCAYYQDVTQGYLYSRYFAWHTVWEMHCNPGFVCQGRNCSCVEATGSVCDYGTAEVSWKATSAPQYINVTDTSTGEACLWKQLAGVDNGDGTFSVTYEDTMWMWSDHDGFSGSPTTSGTAIGGVPDTAPGEPDPVWPWMSGGGETQTCQQGREATASWALGPNDEGLSYDSVCLSNGCAATVDSGVLVCLEASDYCQSTVTETGLECSGSESGTSDTDNAEQGGNAGIDTSGIESRLDNIADLLMCDPAVDPRCADAGQPVLGTAQAADVTVNDVYTRISNAPIVAALGNIGTSMPVGDCPAPTSDPISWLDNTTVTLDAHCAIWDQFDTVIHAFMLTVWSLIGIGTIFRA